MSHSDQRRKRHDRSARAWTATHWVTGPSRRTLTPWQTTVAAYGVTLGEDGMPMAVHIPTVGHCHARHPRCGGEVTLTFAEDRVTCTGYSEAIQSDTVIVSKQREYPVRIVDGLWRAALIKPMPVVRLGHSGVTVTLIHDQSMAWWIDPETPVATATPTPWEPTTTP